MPGTSNQTWFKADQEGIYDGASYAFSGASYAAMRTRVRVVDVPDLPGVARAAGRAAIQEARPSCSRRTGSTGG